MKCNHCNVEMPDYLISHKCAALNRLVYTDKDRDYTYLTELIEEALGRIRSTLPEKASEIEQVLKNLNNN